MWLTSSIASLSSTVDPVLVLPTLLDSSLSSKRWGNGGSLCIHGLGKRNGSCSVVWQSPLPHMRYMIMNENHIALTISSPACSCDMVASIRLQIDIPGSSMPCGLFYFLCFFFQ